MRKPKVFDTKNGTPVYWNLKTATWEPIPANLIGAIIQSLANNVPSKLLFEISDVLNT